MANKPSKYAQGKSVKPTDMPDLSQNFSSQQLGLAIMAKRTGMKLSLVDVSTRLSISKPTLIKIEKGDVNVKLVTVLRVMEFLGLSFKLLSDGVAEQHPADNLKAQTGLEDWY